MKYCKKCETPKDSNDFHKDSRAKDGKRGHCKNCESLRKKKFWKDNRETILKKWKEQRKLLKKTMGV